MFRSTDGGRAWREIELPFRYDAVLSLALSPDFWLDNSGQAYAGTESHRLWISSDVGDSWMRLAEAEITGPVNALLNWPDGPAVQKESGLFVTDQQGGWQNILPDPRENHEVVAILNLPDLSSDKSIFVSFPDGRVEVVRLYCVNNDRWLLDREGSIHEVKLYQICGWPGIYFFRCPRSAHASG